MSRRRTRGNGEGSIYPYRDGYAAHVWVTTTSGERRRRYVYGKTYEETQAKWFGLQAKARAGPLPTKVPKLGEYLEYWLTHIVKPRVAPLTYHTYETFVRLYIAPALGSKRVDRLQVRDVQTWLNTISAACQCCAQGKDARRTPAKRRCCAIGRCCNHRVSARTIRDIRGCLRAALSSAQTEELITRNVAALVRLPKLRRTRRKAWTSDEARRFLEHARTARDPLYAAYVLILVLGLRKGEVLGLDWSDVDLDGGELRPGLQLQRVGRRLLHRETKTEASDAPLPLPEICVTALRGRRITQDAARREAREAWQNYGLIFTTNLGRPIEPRTFNRAWDKRVQAADVRRITVHDARRTCGSLLVDLDVHPRVAMEVLRHTDFDLTMEIYAQVSSQATRDALKRLGESLDG